MATLLGICECSDRAGAFGLQRFAAPLVALGCGGLRYRNLPVDAAARPAPAIASCGRPVCTVSLICMLPGTANRKRITFCNTDFVDAHFRAGPNHPTELQCICIPVPIIGTRARVRWIRAVDRFFGGADRYRAPAPRSIYRQYLNYM